MISLYSQKETHWLMRMETRPHWLVDMPERKEVKNDYGSWLVGATDTNALTLYRKAGIENIEFKDKFSKVQFADLIRRTALSERAREQTAAYKETGVLPNRYIQCCDGIMPHQELAAANAHVSDAYAYFMEQGTGKTLASITLIDNLRPGARAIVVCPNNVRFNWQKEIERFSLRQNKIAVMRGGQMKRMEALIDLTRDEGQDCSICIVGYDSIPGMWEYLHMIPWDVGILDESHYIKSPRSKRAQFAHKLRDRCKKRILMTGTPVANTIFDLYSQLEFLGPGMSGFIDFDAFKRFYGVFEKSMGDEAHSRLVAIQNMPIMKERLSRYSLVVTKKEALPNLPDKVYDVEEVELTEEQQQAYDSLAHELSLRMDGVDEENPLIVNNILTQLLKLAQITSGFLNIPAVKDPDGNELSPKKTLVFADNPKVNRLMEILGEKKYNEKTIVWACFTPDIDRIKTACDNAGIDAVVYRGDTNVEDRIEAERRFNEDPNCKVFIGNAGAGGVGLNLLGYPPQYPDITDTNADHTIYFSQDWSSLKRSQSGDRNHRRGTRVVVRETDLCVPGTIDETIRNRVVEKRIAAFQITDVRSILKEVFNRE